MTKMNNSGTHSSHIRSYKLCSVWDKCRILSAHMPHIFPCTYAVSYFLTLLLTFWKIRPLLTSNQSITKNKTIKLTIPLSLSP